jgi:hypothetical protein
MNFSFTFFAETKTFWSQGPVNEIFENRIQFGGDIQLFNISACAQPALNHFRVCSASDEISSAHAQPAIKFVPHMLSQQ